MLIGPVQHSSGRFGYIDETGDVRIPFEFEELGRFSEGLAWFLKDGKIGFLNESGSIMIAAVFDRGATLGLNCDFCSGLAAVRVGTKQGYINRAGSFVIPCRFDSCSSFVGNIALVQDESGFSVLGVTGEVISQIPHSDVAKAPYAEDLIKVYPRINGEPAPAFVDRYGALVAGPFVGCEEVYSFNGDAVSYAAARWRATGLAGFLNREWKVQIPFSFGNVQSFAEGLAGACTPEYVWGYIDPAGKWVGAPQWSEVHVFINGTASVKRGKRKAGKWFIIDKGNRLLNQDSYDEVVDLEHGYRCVSIGKRVLVIDPCCRTIWSSDRG